MIERRLSFLFAEVHANKQTSGEGFTLGVDFFFRQLWLLWRAPQIILACNLELHCPAKTVFFPAFRHCSATERVYYCVQRVCPLGALPSVLTLAAGARRFPRVLRTDIPFIFPPGRLR